MTRTIVGGVLVAAALLLATSFAGAGELGSVFDLSLRWGADRLGDVFPATVLPRHLLAG